MTFSFTIFCRSSAALVRLIESGYDQCSFLLVSDTVNTLSHCDMLGVTHGI